MDRTIFQQQFGMFGESDVMRQVTNKIAQVSRTDISVLLLGESGVGKDVTARAIHGLSPRKHKHLVLVNCGAIPEGTIESELFGHEKGSFTGAVESREGYFEKANGGTIFLDEIADTPKNVQVKLLRVLETGEFFRVGSSQIKRTDARVIAATNKDLWEEVQKGNFREDLYYRLDTVTIKLPPLRERQEDIIPIFKQFVTDFSARYDSVFQGFSDDARQLLISYRWPGNIRELRNVAEQLVVLEKSQFIDASRLKKYLKGRQQQGSADNLPVHVAHPNANENSHRGEPQELGLVYKALLELRNEMTDIKSILSTVLFNTGPGNLPSRILPTHNSSHQENTYSSVYPVSSHSERKDISLGLKSLPVVPQAEIAKEPEDDINSFFGQDEIPSLEATEKFLIKKALEKYSGNRRKASESLGVSERTLYRKIDQYGLG